MRHKLVETPSCYAWLLLGSAISLWAVAVARSNFAQLTWSAPFLELGPVFWLGLLLSTTAFFLGQGWQRIAAVGLLAWYFVATVAFIYPYPAMHDSIANA